jgi:hypothetical protein
MDRFYLLVVLFQMGACESEQGRGVVSRVAVCDLVRWRQATAQRGDLDRVNSMLLWFGGEQLQKLGGGGRHWPGRRWQAERCFRLLCSKRRPLAFSLR